VPNRLYVYIAGPYTAPELKESEENAKAAIDAGIAILKKGHIPFIPHLTHYVDLRARELSMNLSWADYMRWDDAWLTKCDALLYLGSSKGADIELSRAKQAGKLIFYSLAEVPEGELAAKASPSVAPQM
jgi:Domain of unknown function (DUF4406)